MQRANSKSAAEAGAVTSGLGEMFPLVCRGLGGDEASPSGELEKREKGKKNKITTHCLHTCRSEEFSGVPVPRTKSLSGCCVPCKSFALGIAKMPNLSSVFAFVSCHPRPCSYPWFLLLWQLGCGGSRGDVQSSTDLMVGRKWSSLPATLGHPGRSKAANLT